MDKRILLADDSLTIQKVVELTFMDEPFDVGVVGSGDEAITRLEAELPDVVIADVHMPGPSGYDVCRRAKQLAPNLPVLLLVGTFETLDEEELEASGADGHLKKPFDSQELLNRVQELAARAGAAVEPATGLESSRHEDLDVLDDTAQGGTAQGGTAQGGAAQGDAAGDEGSGDGGSGDEAGDAPGSAETVLIEALPESMQDDVPAADDDGEAPDDVALAVDGLTDESLTAGFAIGKGAVDDAYREASSIELADDELEETLTSAVGQAAAPDEIEAVASEAPSSDLDWNADGPEVEPSEVAGEDAEEDLDDVPSVEIEDWAPAAAEPAEAAEAAEPQDAAPEEAPRDIESAGVSALSDDDVERVARRVVELLGDDTVREVAWDVIPDMAEVVIGNRIRELEADIES